MKGIKRCNRCKEYKKYSLFSKNKATKSGLATYCKDCMRTYKYKYTRTEKGFLAHKKREEYKKKNDFYRWKAQKLRGNWRKKARDYKLDLESIPSLDNIEEWLKGQEPFKCHYSGEALDRDKFQIDHKIPLSIGGTYSLDNIVISSPKMNRAKGSLTDKEFSNLLTFLESLGERGKSYILSRLSAASYVFGGRGR